MKKLIPILLLIALCSACQSFNSVKDSIFQDAQNTVELGTPIPNSWSTWAIEEDDGQEEELEEEP